MEPLFTINNLQAFRLTPDVAPVLQNLLERCGDYYEMVEGRPAEADAAAEEFKSFPDGHEPQDAFCLGLRAAGEELAGTIIALRHFRRRDQWYVGLFMLAPEWRARGIGRSCFRAFEDWAAAQGADSILLAAVGANIRAQKFWVSLGFKQVHEYQDVPLGLLRHRLIEYEKDSSFSEEKEAKRLL